MIKQKYELKKGKYDISSVKFKFCNFMVRVNFISCLTTFVYII